MANPDFYTVAESFIGPFGEYHKGEVVTADDPAVKRTPLHFEPLVIRGQTRGEVEQATAAPGEKRSYRRKKAEPGDEPELAPEGKPLTVAAMKGRA